MPAAKGSRLASLLALLLAVVIATPAAASIPRDTFSEPDPRALLAAVEAAPEPASPPRESRFRLYDELVEPRHRLSLAELPEPRLRLLPPTKTRVRAIELPEPVFIEVEPPPTPTRFELYGHLRPGIASEGTFSTPDPLGYVDGPSKYSFVAFSPYNFADPLGLDTFVVKYGDNLADADVYVTARFIRNREDEAMTDSAFAAATTEFVGSATTVWSALKPTLIVSYAWQHERRYAGREFVVLEGGASPYVYDITWHSREGRSNSLNYFVASANPWIYAHEFGHLLGLNDYYTDTWSEENDRIIIASVPDVDTFGERATRSFMGNLEMGGPALEDIEDILNPAVTLYEKGTAGSVVHHIDLRGDGRGAVQLFEKIAGERRVDIGMQLRLLSEKRNSNQRRFIVRWIMNSLFRGGRE